MMHSGINNTHPRSADGGYLQGDGYSQRPQQFSVTASLETCWRIVVRIVGNPEAIHLDVANPWNGRGIWREHRSNHRGTLWGYR